MNTLQCLELSATRTTIKAAMSMQQRDSVISSRGTNARRRKIGGCPAYVAHKETAAIGDVFPRYFYYHATSWIGRQSDPTSFLR